MCGVRVAANQLAPSELHISWGSGVAVLAVCSRVIREGSLVLVHVEQPTDACKVSAHSEECGNVRHSRGQDEATLPNRLGDGRREVEGRTAKTPLLMTSATCRDIERGGENTCLPLLRRQLQPQELQWRRERRRHQLESIGEAQV